MPKSITSSGVTGSYVYDGERATRAVTQGGVTTTSYYFGGLYEEEKPSGTTRSHYTLKVAGSSTAGERDTTPHPH